MPQGKTIVVRGAVGLGAAALLAACFVSGDQKRSLTCDEAAARGFPCEPSAGAAGAGGPAAGSGGAPLMGAGGAGGTGAGGNAGGGGSGGLMCAAPTVDCDGACVDVNAADAANCGQCGYACEAGRTCQGGTCQPLALVDESAKAVAPYALTLDADFVYFASPVADGAGGGALPVRKVARGGGAVTNVPFSGGAKFRTRSLTLLDATLYFGDLDGGGQIFKSPKVGGTAVPHVTGAQPAVQQIVAADDKLWWATFDGNSRLRRVAATGSPTMAEELLPGPSFLQLGRVPALAVVGTGAAATAFWLNVGGSSPTDKGLWRKAGAAAPSKLVPDGEMVALALSETEVFVADAAAGIGKVAANATASATLTAVVKAADVGGAVQGLAVASGRLYWLAFNAGQLELHRAALDGSEARVLGRVAAKSATYWGAPIGPAQLAVDGGFVYFSDPGTLTGDTQAAPNLQGVTGAADGAIYRLPQ